MSETQRLVPVLDYRGPRGPIIRTQVYQCEDCGWHVSAVTHEGLSAALRAHVEYVNATADKATDPHFEMLRLDALL